MPVAQLEHAVDDAAPGPTEKVPAGQLSHTVAPAAAAYDPPMQAAHEDELAAPVIAENRPAAQLTQAVAPAEKV